MYQKKEVERFLFSRGIKPSTIRVIQRRMVRVADDRGFFDKRYLIYVMGKERELARLYEQAWNEATEKLLLLIFKTQSKSTD
jgi:hypothetical protein